MATQVPKREELNMYSVLRGVSPLSCYTMHEISNQNADLQTEENGHISWVRSHVRELTSVR